jgi:nitronate monooxygenase
VFQFGTRPLLTQESPIPQTWKDALREIEPGDVLLHRFSPTGFYSSAVRNPFLRSLEARSARQIPYSKVAAGEHTVQLDVGVKGKNFWVTPTDLQHAHEWVAQGHTDALRTPDDTVVFVATQERDMIREDQAACMGCLSHCGFSSWKDHDDFTTGRLADPRSFCIQKKLQGAIHGEPLDQNLIFAGHAAYRFKQDPFYSNNFTPTVKELVERILTGD